MPKLVFDIETRGYSGQELEPLVEQYLTKNAKNKEEEKEALEKTGLLPVAGEVVAIAMLNADSGKGKVYFQAPDNKTKDYEKDGVEYIVVDEKEMLEKFWQDIRFFEQVITYNGRGFDAPFLIFRSIVHGVKPTKNLMPYRYSSKEHLDLLDQLCFYGAFRKFSLEIVTHTFGINNPKEEGVSGADVSMLYEKGDFKKIAEYCMRDVHATNDLYNKVKEYIEI